jgi:predicted GIY-YIG superfamily endonuclease
MLARATRVCSHSDHAKSLLGVHHLEREWHALHGHDEQPGPAGIRAQASPRRSHLVEGFTSKYNCIRLVWFEEWADVRSAIARETQIKGWRRAKTIALIEGLNPHWNDLAKNWGMQMGRLDGSG